VASKKRLRLSEADIESVWRGRLQAAVAKVGKVEAEVRKLRDERDEMVREAYKAGVAPGAIQQAANLSRQRVSQLTRGLPTSSG